MNKDTILKEHLEFKKTSVHNINKLQDIERNLKRFIHSSKKPLNKFKEDDLNYFINSLSFQTRTMNDVKAYIKVFIKWHYPDWSLRFRNLDKICKQQKPQRAYEPEQMLKYKDIEKIVQNENDLMWKVYWLTLFFGGFRISEACRLLWNQILFEPKGVIIKLHATKTNKDFYKSLPEEAEQLLKELKKNSNSEFIFPSPTKGGECINRHLVWERLQRLSKKALGKSIPAQIFRHSIATILYSDDRLKDDDVAQQMGHTKDMRETYKNMSIDKIKEKAKGLLIKTKDMTPTEREELKKMIEEQNKRIFELEEAEIKKQKEWADIVKRAKKKFNIPEMKSK